MGAGAKHSDWLGCCHGEGTEHSDWRGVVTGKARSNVWALLRNMGMEPSRERKEGQRVP